MNYLWNQLKGFGNKSDTSSKSPTPSSSSDHLSKVQGTQRKKSSVTSKKLQVKQTGSTSGDSTASVTSDFEKKQDIQRTNSSSSSRSLQKTTSQQAASSQQTNIREAKPSSSDPYQNLPQGGEKSLLLLTHNIKEISIEDLMAAFDESSHENAARKTQESLHGLQNDLEGVDQVFDWLWETLKKTDNTPELQTCLQGVCKHAHEMQIFLNEIMANSGGITKNLGGLLGLLPDLHRHLPDLPRDTSHKKLSSMIEHFGDLQINIKNINYRFKLVEGLIYNFNNNTARVKEILQEDTKNKDDKKKSSNQRKAKSNVCGEQQHSYESATTSRETKLDSVNTFNGNIKKNDMQDMFQGNLTSGTHNRPQTLPNWKESSDKTETSTTFGTRRMGSEDNLKMTQGNIKKNDMQDMFQGNLTSETQNRQQTLPNWKESSDKAEANTSFGTRRMGSEDNLKMTQGRTGSNDPGILNKGMSPSSQHNKHSQRSATQETIRYPESPGNHRTKSKNESSQCTDTFATNPPGPRLICQIQDTPGGKEHEEKKGEIQCDNSNNHPLQTSGEIPEDNSNAEHIGTGSIASSKERSHHQPYVVSCHIMSSQSEMFPYVEESFMEDIQQQLLQEKNVQLVIHPYSQYYERGVKHLLMLCLASDSPGSSVNALKRKVVFKAGMDSVLVLFHHKSPEKPLYTSNAWESLPDQDISVVYEARCWKGSVGFYDCQENMLATKNVVEYIADKWKPDDNQLTSTTNASGHSGLPEINPVKTNSASNNMDAPPLPAPAAQAVTKGPTIVYCNTKSTPAEGFHDIEQHFLENVQKLLLEKENIQLNTVPLTDENVSRAKHLLFLCLTSTRVESCVETLKKDITFQKGMDPVLVLFQYTSADTKVFISRKYSLSMFTTRQFNAIYDARCMKASGFYKCKENNETVECLVKYITERWKPKDEY